MWPVWGAWTWILTIFDLFEEYRVWIWGHFGQFRGSMPGFGPFLTHLEGLGPGFWPILACLGVQSCIGLFFTYLRRTGPGFGPFGQFGGSDAWIWAIF